MSGDNKDIIYFGCKDLDHYRNEYPKIKKENPKKTFFKNKKKDMIATWDESKSSEGDSEEEQANVALMASTEAFDSGSRS